MLPHFNCILIKYKKNKNKKTSKKKFEHLVSTFYNVDLVALVTVEREIILFSIPDFKFL